MNSIRDAPNSIQPRAVSLNNNIDNSTTPTSAPDISMPLPARFWLLLSFEVPGLTCTLLLIYHLLMDRSLRTALHNHVVILSLLGALLTQLIDIPFYLAFSWLSHVWLEAHFFCKLWRYVNVGVFLMISILIAYASIERHILVFHDKLVSTKRKRILFHYLPLGGVLLYGFTFYTTVIFFPSCEQVYDYSQPWCSYPCYLSDFALSTYDVMVNTILPIILTIVFSIALLVRIIYQKYRLRRPIQWRRYRRMTIQLLSIASLYVFIVLPVPILIFAHLCGLPREVGSEVELYTYFLCYFIPLLLPYVCLGSLPEVWGKIGVIRNARAQFSQRTATIVPTHVQRLTVAMPPIAEQGSYEVVAMERTYLYGLNSKTTVSVVKEVNTTEQFKSQLENQLRKTKFNPNTTDITKAVEPDDEASFGSNATTVVERNHASHYIF
ncbi:unnamed protein product [Rotaria socialis]